MNIVSSNKSAFGGPPACGKCHKPPFSPCMYNHVPDPGPKICACKCHQVEPVQLVDVSIAEDEQQSVGDLKIKIKSAQQAFLEEKAAEVLKKKVVAKLELLEEEVKIRHQLLLQSKTLLASKQALLQKKVRVTFNKCHKFWRGKVVSAHKSFVDEQVDAAKARLGLEKPHNQFNISSMVDTIDKLAPGGCYKSAKPSASPTSTSRPGVRPTSVPWRTTSSRFMVPPPPISYSVSAKKSSHSPAAVPQTSAGYRGDHCIVSYGDALDEEPCCDLSTQLELGDEEYLWDGEYDYSCYVNEEELEIDNSDIVWDDAKELEVETCYDAEEEVSYYDAEVEDCNYYCFAEDCYDY